MKYRRNRNFYTNNNLSKGHGGQLEGGIERHRVVRFQIRLERGNRESHLEDSRGEVDLWSQNTLVINRALNQGGERAVGKGVWGNVQRLKAENTVQGTGALAPPSLPRHRSVLAKLLH